MKTDEKSTNPILCCTWSDPGVGNWWLWPTAKIGNRNWAFIVERREALLLERERKIFERSTWTLSETVEKSQCCCYRLMKSAAWKLLQLRIHQQHHQISRGAYKTSQQVPWYRQRTNGSFNWRFSYRFLRIFAQIMGEERNLRDNTRKC